jgi:hypothetical protein
MLKKNLIFINVIENYLGFLDTGGGMTFQFRNPELNSKLKLMYREELALDFLPKKVIVFFGNDYWNNQIYLFDYIQQKFNFINTIPKNLTPYKMFNNKSNYALFNLQFERKNEIFLFDTGAATTRNNKNYGISFLDGIVFDKLQDKYKVIKKYDDDGSPCIIIPEIIIFNTIVKNVKFLRREKNAFYDFMRKQTGIKHIGAIGGNVFKKFKIICDYKNKVIYSS